MTAEAEVYREAASLIREHGWVQGEAGDETHGFCTAGATHRATALWLHHIRGTFIQALGSAIERLDGLAGQPTAKWNDDKHRTVEDVLILLEQAATEAEKEEQ